MPNDVVRPGVEISNWCEVKWAHGVEQVLSLQGRILLWNNSGHVFADLKLDETRRTATSKLRVVDQPPLVEFSLILGDAVHSFRSALDALVWELAHLDGAKPNNPRRIAFPICFTEQAWDVSVRDLATVPQVFRDRIRSLQPFAQLNPETDMVGLLAEMDNQDKHRGMIAAQAVTNGFEWAFSTTADALGDRTPEDLFASTVWEPMGESYRALVDGNPFMKLTSSVPMTLSRAVTRVPLAFVVDVKGTNYDLGNVLDSVMKVNQLIDTVCSGPTRAAEVVA